MIYYAWKNIKKTENFLKNLLYRGMIKLISLMVDNPPLRIYINRIKNLITFKTVTGYYLELLTSETMKLLGNTER